MSLSGKFDLVGIIELILVLCSYFVHFNCVNDMP